MTRNSSRITSLWRRKVKWREIWISLIMRNSTPFYSIEMGFSLQIFFFYEKKACRFKVAEHSFQMPNSPLLLTIYALAPIFCKSQG